jgi:hypothetical protein
MKKISLLFIISLFVLSNCKKVKEPEFNDPDWRKESLEISYNICQKLESCIQDDFTKIKKSLQNYAKSEVKPEKCSEKNKKSRVYLLKGNDPSLIKQVVRECYSQIQKFSCEEIKSGSIKSDSTCEKMRNFQQGE